ncbi:NAD-dependent epimerase/dehydratase family protein [Paraburkholderia tropica]|uniref:NAD-dependent epimerase/dehydratase family protein n=1 Tax=Paraburkholderia tropica TaxID=92647 RepID=UPI003D2D21A8
MKILITGNMGYIGPVLTAHLRATMPSAYLIGYDSGFFGHCLTGAAQLPERLLNEQYFGDVRDLPDELIKRVDAVVELAAVSNDPMGVRFEQVTSDINFKAAASIAARAAAVGVSRVVFASSCSMYGFAEGGPRKETDPLNPLTAYAKSKVATEEALATMQHGETVATALRFSTACGMSDRLRLDLVLNDFVAGALASKEITVLSDGTPWRPLIEVRDMARAIEWALTRDSADAGNYVAVNVGANRWNYQVRDLAEAVAKAVPGTQVSINTSAPPDKRSYRVDFSLYEQIAPDHQPQVSLEQAIQGLKQGMERMGFRDPNFRGSQFMRLKVLERHMEDGRLNSDLHWVAT